MKHPLIASITAGATLGMLVSTAAAQTQDASRFWGSLEFLYMTRKGSDLPPLVTSSPPGSKGVLDTSPDILSGNEEVNDDWDPAFRVTLGGWLDQDHKIGLFGRFFHLGEQSQHFSMSSAANGTPLLARPFFNPALNAEDSLLVAVPEVRSGTVTDDASNHIYGGDLMLSYNWIRHENLRVDLIGGYQYTRIQDDLSMHSNTVELAGGSFPVGTMFSFRDKFSVGNDFNGIPLGLMIEFQRGPWVISALGKVGLGAMHQNVSIQGSSSLSSNPTSYEGGVFAQPTNIGSHSRNEFTWVPELGISLGYQVTPNCRLTLGYSAMYWSNVALAGDQVDRVVNTTQLLGGSLSGPARPAASIHDTSYWIHGLQCGGTWCF